MTKLEEIARAIWAVRHPDADADTASQALAFGDGRYFHPGWNAYVADARAAVEAMREPSKSLMDEESVLIARMCSADHDGKVDHESFTKLFNAMIDAILNEKPV